MSTAEREPLRPWPGPPQPPLWRPLRWLVWRWNTPPPAERRVVWRAVPGLAVGDGRGQANAAPKSGTHRLASTSPQPYGLFSGQDSNLRGTREDQVPSP